MTLSVVFACPHNVPYKAVLSVEDGVYDVDGEILTYVWREVQTHVLDPGNCIELYVTSSRRVLVTELPLTAPPADLPKA